MKIKSLFAILLCLVLSLGLVACGGETAEKNVDLNAVMTEVNNKHGLSSENMNTISDAETLELYYGIKAEDVKQFAVTTTKTPATDATEIILVEAKDADSAKRVKEALTNEYNRLASNSASYSPELLDVVSNSKVETVGNFVTLIVHAQAKDVTETVYSFLK